MPNWSEGTLKVRGTYQQLLNFCENAFEGVNFGGISSSNNGLEIDKGEDYFEVDISSNYKHWIYLEGTNRGFVEEAYNCLELDKDNPNQKLVAIFDYKQAWCIESKDLKPICKKYNVDMKITAFEMGLEFQQEIEIVDGKIVKDLQIKYDDYIWECPCPSIGG